MPRDFGKSKELRDYLLLILSEVLFMEVTVNLAENVYRDFQRLAEKSSRRVDEVIAEMIQASDLVDEE